MNFDDSASIESARARIAGLCARLTGSSADADDLAQLTLLEAWRSRDRLRDEAGSERWLNGIAANVCRRWRARRARTALPVGESVDDHADENVDLEAQVLREELADVLDAAMGTLGASDRGLLTQRYVEDLPIAEIAARNGMTPGSVTQKLHRGRRTLRRVLMSRMPDEATALGLLPAVRSWEPTRIWCPSCGAARMSASLCGRPSRFTVRCPSCRLETTSCLGPDAVSPRGHWRRLLDVDREAHVYYQAGLEDGLASCGMCGRLGPMQIGIPASVSGVGRDIAGLHQHCHACGALSFQPVFGLALTDPTVLSFWRRHKRIRTLAETQMTYEGHAALEVSFGAVAGLESISVVRDASTLRLLAVRADLHRQSRAA